LAIEQSERVETATMKVTLTSVTVLGAGLLVFSIGSLWNGPDAALAAKDGGNFKDIPVSIAFGDAAGERIRSDDGPYSAEEAGVLTGVGRRRNCWLDLTNTAARTLRLDLTAPASCALSVTVDVDELAGCDPCDDGTPALPAGGVAPVEFDLIAGENLDDMAVGTVHEDNARLRFEVGGEGWVLYWGPYQVPGGWTYCPDASPVRITRTDPDTWTIQTTGDHLACLYREENPPHRPTEYHGQFTVPFSATVTALEPQADPVGSDTAARRKDGDPACVPCLAFDGDGDSYDAAPCGTDCDDDDPGVHPGAAEVCDDGVDNDCDGLADGDDPACSSCTPTHNNEKGPRCSDGIDNDCDGAIDGEDSDC
jgi:hypothetical protein